MTNTTNPPSASNAIQKAREERRKDVALLIDEIDGVLAKELCDRLYGIVYPKLSELQNIHFYQLLSENHKLQAERDVALKGYKGMRECMKNIPTHETDEAGIEFCLGCNEPYQHGALCWVAEVESILTSFPEIK